MAYYNPAQGQPQVQYQAPIVYYAAPAITFQPTVIKHYGPHYDRQTSTGLGATQVVLACLSFSAGVMAIVYEAELYYVGIGIWAGIFYLIAGAIAIAAGKDPKNSLVTGTLVCSVLDMVFGIAQITIASIGLTEDLGCYGYYCPHWMGAAVTSNSMMIAVGVFELMFGIWLTVISGRAINEGSKAQIAHIPVQYAPHQPEAIYMQAPPVLQSQPPPYCVQPQYPSTSDQPQMMYVGVHQAPMTSIKF